MTQTVISVCLCTFRREHVFATLQSLAGQQLPDGVKMEIVVVNNDPQTDLKERVREFADDHELVIKYDIEPEQNISLARNRSIELASGNWIAFIDDDEMADPGCLTALHEAALAFDADAVMGVVKAKYPDDTPLWMIKSGVFEKDLPQTGTVVHAGRTSNALVRAVWIKEKGHRFDPGYGLTGGGDYLFFLQIQNEGGKIVSCREAVVSEFVEKKRLNIGYLIRRAMRGGEGYARIHAVEGAHIKRIVSVASSIVKMLILAGYALIWLPLGRHRSVPAILRVIQQIGKLRFYLGVNQTNIYEMQSVE